MTNFQGGMGFKVIVGMVIDHFEIFWNALGQRLCHLPNLLLFTFSEYTNEVTKLGKPLTGNIYIRAE